MTSARMAAALLLATATALLVGCAGERMRPSGGWQAELEARYGSGVVRLVGTFEPVD